MTHRLHMDRDGDYYLLDANARVIVDFDGQPDPDATTTLGEYERALPIPDTEAAALYMRAYHQWTNPRPGTEHHTTTRNKWREAARACAAKIRAVMRENGRLGLT